MGGQVSLCVVCRAFAEFGEHEFPAMVQITPGQSEQLLEREAMNQLVVIFDGPNAKVVFQVRSVIEQLRTGIQLK